jgi:hypothetical protein
MERGFDSWEGHSMRQYRYVGSSGIRQQLENPAYRVEVRNGKDVIEWIEEMDQVLDGDSSVTATFVIDLEQRLWIADQHSEHVVCARGQEVLSAGEIMFAISGNSLEVVEVTNQSTGFCPEPESWQAVSDALNRAGIERPAEFTTAYLFRRCKACGTTNIIKDDWYVCGVCEAELSQEWNYY